MGKIDVITKSYMKRNEVFADAFNFMMYKGERIIDPERLKPLDTTELAVLPVLIGSDENKDAEKTNKTGRSNRMNVDTTTQKYRDLLKSCVIMQDDEMSYIMLGIENQSDIHYAMPVRNMVYDALQYAGQISEISSRHQHEIQEKQTEQYNSRKISQAEYLSGFYKSDRITPVITLVVHFGADNWDGPLSLHDMMSIKDENILSYIQNYKIHLIDPAGLTDQDLTKFQTSLREVLGYIKYSKDKNKLSDYIHDNPRMNLNRDAAMVIKTVTNTNIDISEDEEEIDMCQAIDDMLMDRETIGLEKGRHQGEAIGLEKGRCEGEAIGREKGRCEGEAIGLEKGRSEEQSKLILSMFQNGIPALQIATIVQRSLNEVESILEVRR